MATWHFYGLPAHVPLLLVGFLLTIAARVCLVVQLMRVLRQRGDVPARHYFVRAALVFVTSAAFTRGIGLLNYKMGFDWSEAVVVFLVSLIDVVFAGLFFRFKHVLLRIPTASQYEQKISELEDAILLHQLFERLTMDAWVTSVNGVVTKANRRAAEIFRCAETDLVGKHYRELVAPESLAVVEERMQLVDDTSPYELKIIWLNGEGESWIEGRAAEVGTERHATFKDVTLYRKNLALAQARYADLKTKTEIREKEDLLIAIGQSTQQ